MVSTEVINPRERGMVGGGRKGEPRLGQAPY